MRRPTVRGSSRLLFASVFLGLFVLFDLGLLGWLIFRSLSQREIQRLLLETREEAETLAEQLSGRLREEDEDDLYTVVAVQREVQTYIDSILAQRDIVRTVEIRDHEGRLVFRRNTETEIPVGDQASPRLEPQELGPRIEEREFSQEESYELNVPIGRAGFLHIGLSADEIGRRVEVLRRELIRQTVLIGAVTLVLLGLAYWIIWWLWRRSRRLEELSRESERLAYIGTLASGLAHEIRNPLNSLNLNMQLLGEEEAGRSPSSRRLLAITQTEIKRLERLVTDFLQYAKPRPPEMRELAAAGLLREARELLVGELESRGVELRLIDDSRGARVRVDRAQFHQLLINLVQNAIAATEQSGRPPRVELRARRDGDRAVLEVADNGVGIAPAERERIFDLFYSTRKGGTGLGLAVVERIVRAHDGEIEVESRPGEGTRLSVRLPLVAADPGPAPVTRLERSAEA